MKLVVGLGNPGEKYKNTRHNVGVWVVDRLQKDSAFAGQGWLKNSTNDIHHSVIDRDSGSEKIILLKPQLFMNKSGVALKKFLKKFQLTKLEDLWVVHDDLDIKLGEYKISFGKGPKDHNGLKNIYEQIGTKDFWHVRVGIAPVFTGQGRLKNSTNDIHHSTIGRRCETTGADYVLSSWKPEERKIVNQIIDKVVKELRHVLA